MIQYYKKDKERGSGGEWILIERLDKILAGTGRWSRREAGELVRAGRVEAAGAVARRPEEKSAGLLSATEDPRQPTVLDLLPEHLRRVGLFPVGRLDKDTEGLLLLTNDGPLGHRLLTPARHVDKVYFVRAAGRLDEEDAAAFRAGMMLGDGLRCLPAELELLPEPDAGLVTLREGKYHQVKRMLAARGKPVLYLKRLSMGPLELDPELVTGGWRPLTEEERKRLKELE